MKNFILIFSALLLMNVGVFAQTNIRVNVHHKLGAANFGLNTAVTNNLGIDFDVTRLEYYLCDFSLIHDGGFETVVSGSLALVDASFITQIDLGSHSVLNLEEIRFHIGVDSVRNHSDPASYASGHPLAPRFPAMHWGWAAGYRFVAIEGNGGNNLSQIYQFHALEDPYYYQAKVVAPVTAANGQLVIDIDADYVKALEYIDVSGGPIIHGGFGDAITVLENFKNLVFSASGAATSILDFNSITSFEAFPNPTTNGSVTLMVSTKEALTYDITLTDVLGRQLQQLNAVGANTPVNLQLENAGLYIVRLSKDGHTLATTKLVSK